MEDDVVRVARPVSLNPEQRQRLERQSRTRSLPARQLERARIVLRAADGWLDKEIAEELGVTPEKAARWRNRFLDGGITGLRKDAPRPGRPHTFLADKVKLLVDKTTQEKPPAATHWSTRTMAKGTGISEATVRRIWHAHGLKPHLVKTFKVSNDPQFAEKLEAIVGLYLNPPEHAWCSAWMKRARSKLWIGRSPDCRSRKAGVAP
jgi:transposase